MYTRITEGINMPVNKLGITQKKRKERRAKERDNITHTYLHV